MPEAVDVAVVGGGLAGLAAALALKEQGRRVVVLEAGPTLGGKAGTRATPAGDFPTGPTSFNGRNPVFWRLLEGLGLAATARKLHPRAGARFIVREGKLEGIHPNPLSVLTTGALTLQDKLALAKDLLGSSPGAGAEDESLDAFLERRFGRALVDHFFAAVLTGIFAGDLKQLSAASCMPALVTAEKEYGSVLRGALSALRAKEVGARPGLYTLDGGFGRIGEAAAARLANRTQCPVLSLERTQHGVLVRHAQGELAAQDVVLATEAPQAAALLGALCPAAAQVLAGFRYAPLALAQWAEVTPQDSRLPYGFGYLAAPVEGCFALGTLFVGDLQSESPRRFSTFVGGGLFPDRAGLDDAALWDGVRADVQRLTGGVVGQPLGVVRWPQAVFQPPPGHGAMLARLRAALGELPVVLAGSYLGGAAMKDALASGFAAAEQVLHAHAGAARPPVNDAAGRAAGGFA